MASPPRTGSSRPALAARARGWLVGSCLFALALGIRALYAIQAARSDPAFGVPHALADSLYYHRRASALALGETPQPLLDYLSPAYTLALSLIYRVAGPEPLVAIGVQCTLGALSCVMLYVIGRRVFSEASGVTAGLMLAGYGPQVYYGGLLLSDTLVLTLNLAFLLALVPPRGRLSLPRCGAAGALLGLAVGARPNAMLLLPVALLAIALQRTSRPWRRHALSVAALSLGLAVGLAPFAYRNYQAIGQPALLGATGGINFWKGNGPHATGTHVFLTPGESRAGVVFQLFGTASDEEVMAESREYTRRTIEYVREHPRRTLRLLLKKVVLFFHAVEIGIRDQFYFARFLSPMLWIAPLSFGVVAPLGLAGMWLARARREAVFLHAAFGAQLLSLVAVFVLGRYRLVAVAILALFAGFSLTSWAKAWHERASRGLLASLLVALVAAALIHVPLAEFPAERGFARRHQELALAWVAQERHRKAIQAFEAAAREASREAFPELAVAQARLGQAASHLALGEVEAARVLIRPFLESGQPEPIRVRARALWQRAAEIEAQR